jgi:glycosyltransferase involved in cell wall biosynthesis
MKILFFTRRFYPDIGGVETHVREVGKRLVEAGHEVSVVAEEAVSRSARESAKSVGEIDGISVYRISISGGEKQKKFSIWTWLWQHKELIAEADVVHCHDVFFWYLPFRFLYPHKKIFTTFHGYETVFPPAKNAIRMRKISEKLSMGNICVGEYIAKWYGTRPTLVMYGGVDNQHRAKGIEQRENGTHSTSSGSSKWQIVFIGRMEEDTGVMQYVELLELLKKDKISFSFTAVGDGRLREKVEKYGEVTGFVEDVSSHLQKADVVFASSYLSILQALAGRKLVVALYDNELKKDYLLLTPFAKYIVAESSAHEAFQKIKYYTLNPNRLKTLMSEGSDWAEKQTWDEVAKIYLRLWKIKH